ncbi:MAG: agl cluster protein AglQ [Desulfamplus sp.]|nr:agl cluster protein AglQ [Desulfamplus sp.]
MQLSDLIVETSKAALIKQQKDGSFPPGWNGPYNDPETPVRNTSHWLITLLKAYDISENSVYKDAAYRAAEYLCSQDACPMGASFFCRKNPEKDFCNGLIGQAWVIEALMAAGQKLESYKYISLAKSKFELHPFDFRIGLWRKVNVDGSYSGFDMTFNHQLWFAAAGAMIDNNYKSDIGAKVDRFLKCSMRNHLQHSPSGRIIHSIDIASGLKKIARKLLSIRNFNNLKMQMRQRQYKEIGYHAFNMYAFALLKQQIEKHDIWRSAKFSSILNFMNQNCFSFSLGDNEYAYPYNPPGFEIAFALQVFQKCLTAPLKPIEWWVNKQLRHSFNSDEYLLNRNTNDPETLSARFYEATRLNDMDIVL